MTKYLPVDSVHLHGTCRIRMYSDRQASGKSNGIVSTGQAPGHGKGR